MDDYVKSSLSSIRSSIELVNEKTKLDMQSIHEKMLESATVINENLMGPIRKMQKEITDSADMSGITTSIQLLKNAFVDHNHAQVESIFKNFQNNLETLISATSIINKLEKENLNFSDFESYNNAIDIYNEAYHHYMSQNSNNIDTNYILDSIDSINNESNADEKIISESTIAFIEENKEILQEIINCYNDSSIKEHVIKKNKEQSPDWKFIIGSVIIPLLIAIISFYQSQNDNKIEINNYYGNNTSTQEETSVNLTQEDIEKISEVLEKTQNQDK